MEKNTTTNQDAQEDYTDGVGPIEKQVKAPDNWSRGRQRYQWEKCEVGDSFLVTNRDIRQMCSAAAAAKPTVLWGWKWSCSTEYNEDKSKRGIRITRIK